jgi:hypothetical protein
MGAKRRTPRPLGDVAIVCGKDEHGIHILRRRSEEAPVEAGVVRPLAEGQPITGEVISMRRREDAPHLFDVTREIDVAEPAQAQAQNSDGPAQVASDSYRRGWDAIWGRRNSVN